MAKKRKTNKSQQVRDYLAAHPDAGPATVAKELGVSVSLVSAIKYKSKPGPRGKRKVTRRTARGRRARSTGTHQVDPLIAAAQLLRVSGGIQEARAALDTANKVAAELR